MRKPEEIAHEFSPTSALDGRTSFFLVGIGGAGMSALARMLLRRGYSVRGTDSSTSNETVRLNQERIDVTIGHTGDGIEPDMALVVTDAIDLATSPEIARARELGIPIVRRSQALGWMLRGYRVVAVTGTHGKTTTTGMLGAALIAAGLDPLVVVGASIPDFSGPVREGQGEWAVVEACEAYDSFHDLEPAMVVLTNLELDHIDFHGTWERLRDSVVRFVSKMPSSGRLIYCDNDPGATEVAKMAGVPSEPYRAEGLPPIGLPGDHNALNAAGAMRAAELVGADPARALQGIVNFGGAERRLQTLQEEPVRVIDDYAHHPTEVAASIQAVRERYDGRIIAVFQPHLYSRTAPLISEFAQALSGADHVVITDIYPAREAPIAGVSSARVAEQIRSTVSYVPSRHNLPREVARLVKPGDTVLAMGAGNISEFGPALIAELRRQDSAKVRVVVAYGGDSAEREVSLHSGRSVHEALLRQGYDSRLVDVTEMLLRDETVRPLVASERPDVVFLAVHGTHAEDGAIQGFLELLHIPYTGSGILASALAMDKSVTKGVLAREGFRVPQGQLVRSADEPICTPAPVIVKPNAQGSTVGLAFVEDSGEVASAVRRALAYDDAVIVEEWIRGIEISVPVLIDRALPPVEIAPTSGRYDFASKYLPGATEEIIPARLPAKVLAEAQEIALRAHRVLGCAGATRTDLIARPGSTDGEFELFVLEVNTLPGMTKTSLLPNSAAAAGISFDTLCGTIVEDARARHASKT